MVSSRLPVTSPSAMKYAVSVGVISIVARRMMPVRPLPPTVAQNRSESGPAGVRWRTSPLAVSSSIERTWLPKLPALWWFLPWMSQPIAPPTVTWRVPGSTGTHKPWGSAAFINWSRLTPASTSTSRVPESIEWMRLSAGMSITSPPPFCALSPYERPSPRAMTPRPPSSAARVTARTMTSGSLVESTEATVGAVRPSPSGAWWWSETRSLTSSVRVPRPLPATCRLTRRNRRKCCSQRSWTTFSSVSARFRAASPGGELGAWGQQTRG